jgi:hypothetical protein
MTAMLTALCVVDMLNPYDHEDADQLTRNVELLLPPEGASFGITARRTIFY